MGYSSSCYCGQSRQILCRKDPDTTYQEEYDYVMRDDYEAQDWFFNNMNWSDVKDVAIEQTSPHFDPSDYELIEDKYLELEKE